MAAVIRAQTVQGAASSGLFEAGKALHGAGRVTGLEPRRFRGEWAGGRRRHHARCVVGIRYRFLVGECDCADAVPEAISDGVLDWYYTPTPKTA